MNDRLRIWGAVAFAALIFLLVQLGALALVTPFEEAGRQVVKDPQDATNSIVYIVAILLATAVMLAAFKFDLDWVVRGFVILASWSLAYYVFTALLPTGGTVAGVQTLPVVASGLIAAALLVHPEWYVIDAAGIVMGAGAAGLFGISFGLFPAILLLSLLAVYDAISVYGTEHMLTLAEGVMDMKVPVILVIPTTLSFSFLEMSGAPGQASEGQEAETAEEDEAAVAPNGGSADGGSADASDGAESNEGETADGSAENGELSEGPLERDALFIGLGDAVMPTIIVASAAFFHSVTTDTLPTLGVPLLALNVPALTSMIGTFIGLFILLWLVLKGRAHAGLPLLNGGAIGGYLVGALYAGLSLTAALGI